MEIETLKKVIGMKDIVTTKGKAYISNRFYNALIICNVQEKKIEKVERFIDMDASSFAYHEECIEHNGTVYFTPENGYGVHAYNSDSGDQKFYDLGFCQVSYSCIFGEKLVLFPLYAKQKLITIDLKKETVSIEDWWNADQILGDAGSNCLYTGIYGDGRIWSHCKKSNCLLISDYQKQTIKKYTIDVEEQLLYGSAYDGNDFWFTVIGKDILYQWNISDGLRNSYTLGFAVDDDQYDYSPCRKVVCANEHVFLIPCNENTLYVLNKKIGKAEMLSRFPSETIYPKTKFWGIKEKIYNDRLYMFCDVTNLMIQVDLVNLNVSYVNTQIIGDQVFDEYVCRIWNSILLEMREGVCLGENGYDWKTWISNFIRLDAEIYIDNAESARLGNIGRDIYQEVLKNEAVL